MVSSTEGGALDDDGAHFEVDVEEPCSKEDLHDQHREYRKALHKVHQQWKALKIKVSYNV